MRPATRCNSTSILIAAALIGFGLLSTPVLASTVNAIYNAASDVPITANSYTANGNAVTFTLNFAPATGTDLMVVKNTGLAFINGIFDNLTNGQAVTLNYGGATYNFVANYYGGSGNDLVLVWANTRAFGWGWDIDGQLGDNTTTNRRLLAVAVTATGVLAGKTVLGLAAGYTDSFAVCSDGTVAGWGSGLLGDGTQNASLVPVLVRASGASALSGKTAVGVAAGHAHAVALCSDGKVVAWGANTYAQLGDGRWMIPQTLVPVAVNTDAGVSALSGKSVVGVAAGYDHNLALCSDGTVAAWGDDEYGELGDNQALGPVSFVPVAVSTNAALSALCGKTVVAVAAGGQDSLALCSDGTVAAWGENMYGQLGDNTTTQRNVPVAVNTNSGVSALYGKAVVAIAAGRFHSLALCSDGTVASWGYNNYGQLGDNTTTQRIVPVAVKTNSGVSALYGKRVVAITAGLYQSMAVCSDGAVVAWGFNNLGQLGDNTTVSRSAPVLVNTTSLAASQHFTRIFAGYESTFTLALVAAPPASPIDLTAPRLLANRSFQFTFSNTPGAFFGVLAATNPALPLTSWTSLTGPTEVTPGQFQFTDPQAMTNQQRFYRVRSP